MRVDVDGVHRRRPLVEILVAVALLVPLARRFVAVAGAVHAALVGVRHLDYPARKERATALQTGWKHGNSGRTPSDPFGVKAFRHSRQSSSTVFIIVFLFHT